MSIFDILINRKTVPVHLMRGDFASLFRGVIVNHDQEHILPPVEFVPSKASVAVFRNAYNSKSPWGDGYGWLAYLHNRMLGACLNRERARDLLQTAVIYPLPDLARRRCQRLSEEDKVTVGSVEAGQHVLTISISSPRDQLFLRAMMMRSITARMERPVWKQLVELLLTDLYEQLAHNDVYLDAGVARLRQGVLLITVLAEDC